MDPVTGVSAGGGVVAGGGLVWWLIKLVDRERSARLKNIEVAITNLEEKVDMDLMSKEMCAVNRGSADKDLKALRCLIEKSQKANAKEHDGIAEIIKELRGYQVKMNTSINNLALKLASNGVK